MKFFFLNCLLILFLLLIYTFYRSEIVWSGNNRSYYYIYYLVLIGLIIFIYFVTFLPNNNFRKYLGIFLISIISTLYLFELYKYYENKIDNDTTFDQRSPLEIYNYFIKTNQKVTISTRPVKLLETANNSGILPLGAGLSNYQTILCNENGYYSSYQSDRYGFNNPDEEWDKLEIEYLLVGDSYVHGACVNRPDDIASVLRNLSKKAVLNLGVTGNGPLLEYATLREYIKPGVKNILWVYFEGNDMLGLDNELQSKLLYKYLDDLNFSQNLKSKQDQIDDLIGKIINETYNNYIVGNLEFHRKPIVKLIKLSETRYLISQVLMKKNKYQNVIPNLEFRNILKLANDLAIENNSKLYFIYLPYFKRYKFGNDYEKLLVQKIVSDLNIPIIDIDKEVFKKEANPLKLFPFERFGHYTVEGYMKTALKIYEKTK